METRLPPGAKLGHFACLPVILLAATLAAQAPAGDTPDKVLGDMLRAMQTLGTTLERVTDEATAQNAAVSLTKLAKELTEIGKRIKAVTPTPEEEKELMAKYRDQLAMAGEKLQKEFARIAALNIKNAEFQQAMLDLTKSISP